jgi:hypothetical protein
MTDDTELVWEDPPPRLAGPQSGILRKKAMKAHPGKWLLWNADCASNVAVQLRRVGFEAQFVSHGGSTPYRGKVYARWPEEAP